MGKELEFKVKLTKKQVSKFWKECNDVAIVDCPSIKKDDYFCKLWDDGTHKEFLRIRSTGTRNSKGDLFLNVFKDEGDFINWLYKENDEDITLSDTFLTIKKKNSKDGIENNEEYEVELDCTGNLSDFIREFKQMIRLCNFFKKQKKAVGFELKTSVGEAHLEIVHVDGIPDAYAEIEFTSDVDYSDEEIIAAMETALKEQCRIDASVKEPLNWDDLYRRYNPGLEKAETKE